MVSVKLIDSFFFFLGTLKEPAKRTAKIDGTGMKRQNKKPLKDHTTYYPCGVSIVKYVFHNMSSEIYMSDTFSLYHSTKFLKFYDLFNYFIFY